MINYLLQLLKISVIEMAYLIGLIVIGGLILGVSEKFSNNFMQKAFGRKGILITAWLGTPIHEIGHAAMCLLFKHRITRMKLLDIRSESNVLGYVEHSFNPNSLYQTVGNLFIGLGPIFSGIISLSFSMFLLLPNSFKIYRKYLVNGINIDKIDGRFANSMLHAGGSLLKSIFTYSNLASLNFWIFLIIAVCISSHIALSKSDIKGAERGFVTLFLLIFMMNLVLRYFSLSSAHYLIQLGRYNAHLMAFLMIALIFSGFTLLVSIIFNLIFSTSKL